ncbi:MAG: CoA transferase [Acidimicrobiales bacterium]|nr:CoA transferase [Acidimicrobiales bacterium]MDP6297927.1 CoA transferase [Acidimicrobiales bacterium]
MSGPMEGIRVVELGVWVAGPAAAGILADWGAEVIKIEPPSGDPARSFQRMLGGDMPNNPPFELDNRGKQSVVLDLGSSEGAEAALRLIDTADVFVTNLRTGALSRLGLDHETLLKRNNRLVYCSITGYGNQGEDADRPAYDVAAFWARSGIASLLTPEGGNPPFQRGGMGDHNTGVSAAAAISAALYSREKTGKGQFVSTSLYRQGAYTIGFDMNIALLWGMTLAVGTRESMGNVAINNYVAGDGKRFWIVGLEGTRHWPPLCRVVGHPEWMEDERFADPRSRAQNATELISLLDEAFNEKTLAEWEVVFDGEPDFFWAPVNTVDDVLADQQSIDAGLFVDVPDEVSSTRMVATPCDFGGTPWKPTGTAPELGANTVNVLQSLGYSPEEIEQLAGSSESN